MKRLGSVVAKNSHTIVVKLMQAERCVGCPVNCNKPLVDLFGMRKNLFVLSKKNQRYDLHDPQNLINDELKLEQLVSININQNDLMFSSLWLYLLPLLFCLLGISAGHYLASLWHLSSDFTALLGLFIGLAMSFMLLREKFNAKHLKFRPKVTIL
ncbi:SoxR reducing system RseC family protein [Marinicella sp. S1101]|uniref:SoxR reducing system RseC family protein n=1 Tax=Marinicella marina TaxID=2996016 RepID=UPI0022609229|nr:SoxR reducing system RseC family protein [Marinicella marina]MCX7555020.1 SoxR reducing system RseC family protein [Marinicella marina]MDJ1141316.1 SoxR reducing system RseC family protein [Marinicella marina]